MEQQMDFLNQRKVSAPTGDDSAAKIPTDLERMTVALKNTRFIHSGEFMERFGWDERKCRLIAARSKGHILGANGGYVLNSRATPEEFDDANGRIYSQGRKMLRRAIQERRVRHQLVGRS
jgi:hypothetical protein